MTSLFVISWQGAGLGLGMARPGEAQVGEKPKTQVPAAAHSLLGLVVSGQWDHRQALVSSDSGKGTSPASLRWTDPEDWTQARQDVSAVAQSWLEGVRAVFLMPEEEDEKWENPWGVPTAQVITQCQGEVREGS